MTYDETLDYIYAQVPMFQNKGAGAYKPGLGTTLALAAHWGNPHQALRAAVHVGGTNGKGSTAHTLAAVLQSAGYRVGLYTSPHLLDFRERIRVDGKPVSRDYVVDFVAEYMRTPGLVELAPSFFELTTVMALRYFADMDVDVAVIEVGLGGRLDCTNIITPLLSVITNISLDHTALLGATEPEIALEKAGIIKPGVPVVVGRAEGDVRAVFEAKARAEEAPIVFACDAPLYSTAELRPHSIRYTGTPWGDFDGELCGACQRENGATILAALSILACIFTRIDAAAVAAGFGGVCSLTGLMGRWMEVASAPVRVLCDTGHNIGGWSYLGSSLADIASGATLHVVLGFVSDKDVAAIMDTMPGQARYYFCRPSVERGRNEGETAAQGRAHGLAGEAFASVAEAYDAAMAAARQGDTVFVGGSTFVVADFLALVEKV
ncbi:MAG: Mur ligase family protein [Muribaculaceae bacterium]|nr:Mur ligase family protein [Muribaculaceae bacterium]